MGIRRKKITDHRRENIEELLVQYSPRVVCERLRSTRDQVSLSTIYKIRRQKTGQNMPMRVVDRSQLDVVQRNQVERQTSMQDPLLIEAKKEHYEDLRKLAEQWRNIFQSFLPVQLLQRELNEASQEALADYFTNVAEKEANDRARERHFVRLTLALNSDPAYVWLRERFPQSTLLATLDVSLGAWQKCAPTYMSAFFDLMYRAKGLAKLLMDSVFHEEAVDSGSLVANITKYRKQRAYTVLVTCGLLVRGLT
jgi:hypothetical protein